MQKLSMGPARKALHELMVGIIDWEAREIYTRVRRTYIQIWNGAIFLYTNLYSNV